MLASRISIDIPALKARHPLGDIVEAAGVKLRGSGRVRQGLCPFHKEGEGSFTVYSDSQRFYCFGCGSGGDVVDFIRRVENLTLPEALRRLGGGIGLSSNAAVRPAKPPRRKPAAPPPRNPTLLTAAARYYSRQLRLSSEARRYLVSRGIGCSAALRLGLGFSSGRGLMQALETGGFTEKQFEDSGLFSSKGAERFSGMVVVPEVSGGLVHWLAGRAIGPNSRPRFQSLPGPKPVLGLGRLGPIPQWVVVAEGLFDWLTLSGWGIPAVAALGTHGLERIVSALRGCPRVFLAFDSDAPGREAAGKLAAQLGSRAAVVTLPRDVADVAELATHPQGRSLFLRLLARAAGPAR